MPYGRTDVALGAVDGAADAQTVREVVDGRRHRQRNIGAVELLANPAHDDNNDRGKHERGQQDEAFPGHGPICRGELRGTSYGTASGGDTATGITLSCFRAD